MRHSRTSRWFWQFKSGSVAPVARGEEANILEASRFVAWDRGLGGWVFYA